MTFELDTQPSQFGALGRSDPSRYTCMRIAQPDQRYAAECYFIVDRITDCTAMCTSGPCQGNEQECGAKRTRAILVSTHRGL